MEKSKISRPVEKKLITKSNLILSAGLLITAVLLLGEVTLWQGQYYTGTTFNVGSYSFNFTVYDDAVAGTQCYSNTTTLTTGNWGEWKTEQSGVSSACNDSSKSYFLEVSIDGEKQLPRKRLTMFSFLRKNVDEITTGQLQTASQIIAPVINATQIVNATQIITTNITTIETGFFSYLGNLIKRITKLYVQEIDVSNNVNVTGNVTASHFIGDGSQLTGIPGANTSWNESYADTKYLNLSGTNANQNVNISYYNFTANNGFFSFLGSLANRITNLSAVDINASGNVQAGNYYSSDGSQGMTNTTGLWTCTDSKCKNTCRLQIKSGLITGCV